MIVAMPVRPVRKPTPVVDSPDTAARRAAVAARDPAADGRFVYAVITTGIYCRPSCPSRAARPENLRFFNEPTDAQAAGFRACRRCRPDAIGEQDRQALLVAQACRQIDAAEVTPTIAELAEAAGLSPFHFHRVFRARTGLTPRAWAAARRAERLRQQVAVNEAKAAMAAGPTRTAKPARTMTEAIFDAGYGSSGRFYAEGRAVLGMAPRAFRDGGRHERIFFAVGQASLGSVLVASTAAGVCAVLMGEEPQTLVRDLQDRFPKAELVGADAGYESVVAQVLAAIDDPRRSADLPLDLRGTAFQYQVWQALRAIPAGETISYAELARRIGRPAAVRAVGTACGANPVAVLVPCHRVVRADGDLTGYRWGIDRKRRLLAREQALSDAASDGPTARTT